MVTEANVTRSEDPRVPTRSTSSRLRLIVVIVAVLGGIAIALAIAGNSGGTLEKPVGGGLWQLAMCVIAVGFLVTGVVQSIRLGKLSRLLLISVASGTAFWQETYGDWGTYLLYSPAFVNYGWGHTPYSSPNQCWWFIPGYVFFYTTFFLAMMKTVPYVRDRWPSINPYLPTALMSFPLFYVFDLALEGCAHGFGWWQYQYAFGPSMSIGTGHFPLLWPILEQVPFMALAAFALTWQNRHGEDLFEAGAHFVIRRKPNQLTILASWIITINVLFVASTILPLMSLRFLAGPASLTVP